MSQSRSEGVIARRFTGGESTRTPDDLIVEEPLAILLDDVQVSSTMRTPGHDFELAAGFCLTEGVLDDATIIGIRYCNDDRSDRSPTPEGPTEFNTVSVSTGGLAPAPTPRLGSTSSSCGICGTEAIDQLTDRLDVLPTHEAWAPEFLLGLPGVAERQQGLFGVTGASHAAGVFGRDGDLLVLREDIGRHNAVDKVIGHLLLESRLPDPDLALFVSGRASFEMVQKAWAAGITALVAVSAPSALAVTTARRAGLTLMGFARNGDGTLYSPEGVV